MMTRLDYSRKFRWCFCYPSCHSRSNEDDIFITKEFAEQMLGCLMLEVLNPYHLFHFQKLTEQENLFPSFFASCIHWKTFCVPNISTLCIIWPRPFSLPSLPKMVVNLFEILVEKSSPVWTVRGKKMWNASRFCVSSLPRTLCPPCHVFAYIWAITRTSVLKKLDFSQLWVWKRTVHFLPRKFISICWKKIKFVGNTNISYY